MNSKFRDLQIQAFAECKTFEDGQFRTDEVFERFAKLLLEESIQVMTKHDYHGEWLGQKLKEHFEVEE